MRQPFSCNFSSTRSPTFARATECRCLSANLCPILLISSECAAAQLLPAQPSRDDIHDLIAIDFITFMVNHDDPVAVAVKRDAEVRLLRPTRAPATRRSRPLFVNADAVCPQPMRDNGRAQLAQHIWRDMAPLAQFTTTFRPLRLKLSGRCLYRTQYSVQRRRRCGTALPSSAESTQVISFPFRLRWLLHIVRQFRAVDREFNAVIIERVMRSRDNDTRLHARKGSASNRRRLALA